jgi:hypothetical protein
MDYHRDVRSACLVMLGALLSGACASGPAPRPAGGPPLIHALLLNGGGTLKTNYRSHLMHLGRVNLRAVGYRPDTGLQLPAWIAARPAAAPR